MDYRESICQAVEEIFSSMIFMEITSTTETIPSPADEKMLSGVIGFAGELQGTILLHMPQSVALSITNAFLELELEEINSEVTDAIGELANMVAGGVKYLLPDHGQNIQLSIPSVISGKGYTCEATGNHSRILVGFELPSGRFVTEMLLRSPK